mgnify:CR=1 FL=1
MGRVLIYTESGDAASQRVKDLLEARRVAYAEINITDNPSRKKEMKSLCGKKSVPQVFFNSEHIGVILALLC